MHNGDEQTDNCVSWQTITTNNQTEKQQLINIHWRNVGLTLTHLLSFIVRCALARLENGEKTIQSDYCVIREQMRVTGLHLQMQL